jgi:hypothetical protein
MPAHSGNAVCPIVGNGCILLLITRRAWLSLRQRNLMHAHVRGQGTTKGKEHSHQEAAWILAKKMVLRGWAVGGGGWQDAVYMCSAHGKQYSMEVWL